MVTGVLHPARDVNLVTAILADLMTTFVTLLPDSAVVDLGLREENVTV